MLNENWKSKIYASIIGKIGLNNSSASCLSSQLCGWRAKTVSNKSDSYSFSCFLLRLIFHSQACLRICCTFINQHSAHTSGWIFGFFQLNGFRFRDFYSLRAQWIQPSVSAFYLRCWSTWMFVQLQGNNGIFICATWNHCCVSIRNEFFHVAGCDFFTLTHPHHCVMAWCH